MNNYFYLNLYWVLFSIAILSNLSCILSSSVLIPQDYDEVNDFDFNTAIEFDSEDEIEGSCLNEEGSFYDYIGSPLLLACESNDLNAVRDALRNGNSPLEDFRNISGKNSDIFDVENCVPIDFEFIQIMIREDDLESQKYLLEVVSESKKLEVAYELGFIDILQDFLTESYSSNIESIERNPQFKKFHSLSDLNSIEKLLIIAILDGNISMLKALQLKGHLAKYINASIQVSDLKLQFDSFKPEPELSIKPLEAACININYEIIHYLLANGADVTETALAWTAKNADLALMKALSIRGNFLLSSENTSVFTGAIMSGNVELIKYLIHNHNFEYTESMHKLACQYGHLDRFLRME